MTDVKFVSLTCPHCGGTMQVDAGTSGTRLTCPYCAHACLIDRGDGAMSLQPLAEELKGTRAASERVAAELAIKRLEEKEIPALKAQLAQWDAVHPRPEFNSKAKAGAVLGWILAVLLLFSHYPALVLTLMIIALGCTLLWVRNHRVVVPAWKALVHAERGPLVTGIWEREQALAGYHLVINSAISKS